MLGNLGNVLCGLGDLTGARESLERARDIFETAYSSDHPEVARTYGNLGIVLCKLGDLPGARQAQEHARDIFRTVYGPNRPEVANSLAHLSIVLRGLGDLFGARRNLEQARQIFETSYGPDHPLARWSADLLLNLAEHNASADPELSRVSRADSGGEAHDPYSCWSPLMWWVYE